jgi:hypothetical protein
LPDADLVRRRCNQRRLVQHVERHLRELVHGSILGVFARTSRTACG